MTQLSDRELATVLAALRVFQSWTSKRTFSTAEYFTDHEPLKLEEIDELCERLNTTDDYDLDDEERARREAANQLRDAAPIMLDALRTLAGKPHTSPYDAKARCYCVGCEAIHKATEKQT